MVGGGQTSGQRTSEDRVGLNSAINLYIIGIFRGLHPIAAGFTFSLSLHRTFTKIDPMLGQKTHFKNFRRIEIIQCLLSFHNKIKLEISNGETDGNPQIHEN